MPPIVAGVDIGRTFEAEEIIAMHNKGVLRGITLEGYVTQVEDGKIKFIPWTESYRFREQTGQLRTSTHYLDTMREEVEREHPILRRTPQERTTSMVMRLIGSMKQYGTMPGFTDEQIKAIMGDYWKVGEPVTEEAVRRLAAHLLDQGEKTNREADSHRVTRQHMTA